MYILFNIYIYKNNQTELISAICDALLHDSLATIPLSNALFIMSLLLGDELHIIL